MSTRKTVTFVTGNKKKLEEVAALLKGNSSIELVHRGLDRKLNVTFACLGDNGKHAVSDDRSFKQARNTVIL